jgi:cyclopropane-fatty-acyl-phospholipid synthase
MSLRPKHLLLLQLLSMPPSSGRPRSRRRSRSRPHLIPVPEVLPPPPPDSAAANMAPLLAEIFPDGPPVQVRFWDGSTLGPALPVGSVTVASPLALRRMIWSPGELGLGRAVVTGDIEITGDIVDVLDALEHGATSHRLSPRAMWLALRAARRSGAVGRPLPAPPEEAHPRGVRHSTRRDVAVVRHHYDVGNEFYGLVLGPSLTYSCARFATPSTTLEDAQIAKFDLVCRKLGLHERRGMRLLDVGCGWGSLAMHAAEHYEATVVGISISPEQLALARERVDAAGLSDVVDIRLQDYRELGGERFDAISSVGMFEHVGDRRMAEYFQVLRAALVPTGRLLNHAISSVGDSRIGPRTFIGRYVFPDGELIDIGRVVLAMERAGFEVRDVESLREHYTRTLREWIANLEQHWDHAVDLVGPGRARIWRLYMAASAVGFTDGGISVHQTLGVRADGEGNSGMPPTRRGIDPNTSGRE